MFVKCEQVSNVFRQQNTHHNSEAVLYKTTVAFPSFQSYPEMAGNKSSAKGGSMKGKKNYP